MLRFYSNGKLFECYIIATWILMSVSNFVNGHRWIRGDFSESGELIYSYPNTGSCLKEAYDNGIYVNRIKLYSKSGHWLEVFSNMRETFKDYKDLMEKVNLDCNGRDVCNTSYSGLKIPRPKIDDSPVDYIDIEFFCRATSVDNITVFNIGLDLDFNILKNTTTYYLVLRLQNTKKRHRHCKILGNPSHLSIRPLHVDFRPNSECNKINSDSLHQCQENMTIVSTDGCYLSWQPPVTYFYPLCYAQHLDIDIHMSTGFVWIRLYVRSDFKLNCWGSKSNNDVISYSTASDTTHSDTTQTLVTNVDGSNPNKPTAETDSGKFDYIYTIVIPASVAYLALLIAIVSIVFCVCRRRERKRNSNYEVPSKTQQDNDPYSVPCEASADVPHASHPTDYLEVIHFDYDYVEPTIVNNQEQEVMYEEIGI